MIRLQEALEGIGFKPAKDDSKNKRRYDEDDDIETHQRMESRQERYV